MSQPQFPNEKPYWSERAPGTTLSEAMIDSNIADILRHRSRSLDTERHTLVHHYQSIVQEIIDEEGAARLIRGTRMRSADEEINFDLKDITGLTHGMALTVGESSPFRLVASKNNISEQYSIDPGFQIRGSISRIQTYTFPMEYQVKLMDGSFAKRIAETPEAYLELADAVMADGDGVLDISKAHMVILPLHHNSLDLYEGVVTEPAVHDEVSIWEKYIRNQNRKPN